MKKTYASLVGKMHSGFQVMMQQFEKFSLDNDSSAIVSCNIYYILNMERHSSVRSCVLRKFTKDDATNQSDAMIYRGSALLRG